MSGQTRRMTQIQIESTEDVGRSEGIRNVVFLDLVGESGDGNASAKRKVPESRRAAGRRLPLKRRRVGPARQ